MVCSSWFLKYLPSTGYLNDFILLSNSFSSDPQNLCSCEINREIPVNKEIYVIIISNLYGEWESVT